MELKISELRIILNVLLDYIEQNSNISIIELDNDAYWFVNKKTLYDPYIELPEITLGQLSDDWTNLKSILERKDDPIGYAFVWMASILRAIGEKYP